jgi:hypothetical protein
MAKQDTDKKWGEDKPENRTRRFLNWVNADEGEVDFGEDEDEDEDEHDSHEHDHEHEYDHYDEDEAEDDDIDPGDGDEAYEGDDEFDYPDEILPIDAVQEEDDGEINYADTIDYDIENLRIPKKQKRQMRRFRAFYIVLSAIVALNVIVTLLLTVNYLPQFGAADNPAVNEVYDRFTIDAVEETGALNLVSAVLYAYRSFDTLGEALVLFTAAIAVVMLLREGKDEAEEI